MEVTDTFIFACPHCYIWQELPRSQLRTWSFCRHCQEPVLLLDANQSLRDDQTPSSRLPQRLRTARSSRRPKALIHQILSVPLGVVLLPFHLAWLMLVMVTRAMLWLLDSSKFRYQQLGWRSLTQFRLSHFLVAVTALAIAMAYYGPRYAREWKLQKEAQAFYESKLALADERESLTRTLASIGSTAIWQSEGIPTTYYGALRGRDREVLDSQASIRLYGKSSNIGSPNQPQWQAALVQICEYPEVVEFSFHSTTIDGSIFESLRASESLRVISINGDTFPLEGYRWCAKCPNLESLSASRYGWPREEGADDVVLEALSDCTSLKSLSLSYVDLTAEGLVVLGGLESLRVLHLKTRRPLDSEAIAQVASLPLEELSLVSQPISDDAIAKLCEDAKMQTLYLGSGMISAGQLRQLQDAAITVRSYGSNPSERAFAPP